MAASSLWDLLWFIQLVVAEVSSSTPKSWVLSFTLCGISGCQVGTVMQRWHFWPISISKCPRLDFLGSWPSQPKTPFKYNLTHQRSQGTMKRTFGSWVLCSFEIYFHFGSSFYLPQGLAQYLMFQKICVKNLWILYIACHELHLNITAGGEGEWVGRNFLFYNGRTRKRTMVSSKKTQSGLNFLFRKMRKKEIPCSRLL